MCSVHIETVPEWEGRIVVVECGVRGRIVDFDTSLSKSSDKLLYPADTLDSGNG